MKNDKVSLYVIADGFKKLNDMAEDDEMLVPYLDAISMQMENKVDNIVKFRQELTATASAIDNEIQRLLAMKKSRERLADRLREYISTAMQAHDIEKLDTGLFKLSFFTSESVQVVDEDKIPEEYILIKTIKQVDKLGLKKAIKAGQEVPGVTLERHKNIQIK